MKHYLNRRIIFAVRTSAASFVVLLLVSVLASSQPDSYPKPQVPSAIGQPAPDFTLRDQGGKNFKLSDQHGHWVLLYFYRGYW